MKSKDFLRSKGILSNDSDHYIIDFHDGREINLGDLLEEYAQQSQPSGMRWVSASERMPDIDTSDKWNNDNKITKDVVCWSKEWGRRFGRYYYNSGRWSIDGVLSSNQIVIEYWVDLTNPSESSPAGAAEGASEGMAGAVKFAKFLADNDYRPGSGNKHWFKWNGMEVDETPLTLEQVYQIFASLSPASNQTEK